MLLWFCFLQVQPVRKSNWRQQHEDFINTIRSAKQFTLAIKEGRPLPPPTPPTSNPGVWSMGLHFYVLVTVTVNSSNKELEAKSLQ